VPEHPAPAFIPQYKEMKTVFNNQNVITGLETTHSFACFDLRFVDPIDDRKYNDAHYRLPVASIPMVERETGRRFALWYRIEANEFVHGQYDESTVRSCIEHYLGQLFSSELRNFMPVASDGASPILVTMGENEAEQQEIDRALSKTYDAMARTIWNNMTLLACDEPVVFIAGKQTRMTVHLGNGLDFYVHTNPHALYRAHGRLTGTVPLCGKMLNFGFAHQNIQMDDVEVVLTPDFATQMLLEMLDKHAPLFRGLEQELRFKD
jgi:hypothetical protein